MPHSRRSHNEDEEVSEDTSAVVNVMSNIARPPKPLVVSTEDMNKTWKIWKQQFSWFSIATNLNSKPNDMQVAILMSLMGPAAVDIYNSFALPESGVTMDTILSKFDEKWSPKLIYTTKDFFSVKFLKKVVKRTMTFALDWSFNWLNVSMVPWLMRS